MVYAIQVDRTAVPCLVERRRALTRALAVTEKVSAAAGDAEALAVARFMRQHGQLGIPWSSDHVAYLARADRARPSTALFMVPVRALDGLRPELSDRARYFATEIPAGSIWAAYYRTHRSILWSSDAAISDVALGVLLLHEGLHAYDHVFRGRTAARESWRREFTARELEYRVLVGIGGRCLEKYLDDLLPSVESASPEKFRLPAATANERRLDALFAPVRNRTDERARTMLLEGAAVMHWVARGPHSIDDMRDYVNGNAA